MSIVQVKISGLGGCSDLRIKTTDTPSGSEMKTSGIGKAAETRREAGAQVVDYTSPCVGPFRR